MPPLDSAQKAGSERVELLSDGPPKARLRRPLGLKRCTDQALLPEVSQVQTRNPLGSGLSSLGDRFVLSRRLFVPKDSARPWMPTP